MQHADFVHLVRQSEQASTSNSAGYRRGLAVLAAVGYAWIAGSPLAAAGLLAGAARWLADGRFAVATAAAVAAAGLLWSGGPAFWQPTAAPRGRRLTPGEAPALFDALERIRGRVDGPRIDEVVLGDSLHASIEQRPRWGLLGGARNTLVLGLPLLMGLDRRRLLAVLAHEYAHLRRHPGWFAAWIYRGRANWSRVYEEVFLQRRTTRLAWGFLGWYVPRFLARTFALARQDEYEADRIAARLLGRDVLAAALVETALRDDWLQRQFWPGHWALAGLHAEPVGPYARMRKLLAAALPHDFAQGTLREALRQPSSVEDPLPGLRDRLDGLGIDARVPAWTQQPVLDLLGDAAPAWVAQFDHEWCRDNETAWRQRHAALGRARARIAALEAQPEKDAAAWTELGDLKRRLQHDAPPRPCYDQALALDPHHGLALQGLYACLPPEQHHQRMACLERLHQGNPQYRWWAAQAAIAALEHDPARGAAVLELWRARLNEARAAEARAWSELAQQPFLEHTRPADLSEFERYEFEAELARWADVRRAWLLRRPLQEFPLRRGYVLVLDLPQLDAAQALELCRALEPTLCLPGPVLLLWLGQSPELAALHRLRPLYDIRVA